MCEKTGGTGTTLLAMAGVAAWWTLRAVAKVLSWLILALVAATVWATPRAWRLTVRVTRAGHRRWVLRRQRADWQPPAGAITDRADDRVTLADLLDNKEASVR